MDILAQALAWSTWFQAHRMGVVLIVSVGLVGVVGWAVQRGQRRIQRGSHGSNRWLTAREARTAGLMRATGYPLGYLGRHLLRVSHKHLLLVGGTGSRKDRSHNLPFTVAYPHSLAIVDVKYDEGSQGLGENYYYCGAARLRRGPVYRLCPGDPSSHAWNPFDTIRVGTDYAFRDAMFLMNSLLAPMERHVQKTDSGNFFEFQGAVAGRGLLLYEAATAPPGQATLTHCSELMLQPDRLLTAMCDHPEREVRRRGQALADLRETSERQFAGEWSAAQKVFDVFTDPCVEAITTHSDFALRDLQYGPRPVTLYLGAAHPSDLAYLHPYYRVLLEALDRVPAESGPRRDLTLLLNEFAQLGYMAILEQAPAHCRARRMWCVLVVQDLEQLFTTYGHETPLWGNLEVKLFHAPSSHDGTAKRLSQMLGRETITVTSTTDSDRRSRTRHAIGRELLTLDEVMGLGPEQVLVWAGQEHPLLLRKPPYWKG